MVVVKPVRLGDKDETLVRVRLFRNLKESVSLRINAHVRNVGRRFRSSQMTRWDLKLGLTRLIVYKRFRNFAKYSAKLAPMCLRSCLGRCNLRRPLSLEKGYREGSWRLNAEQHTLVEELFTRRPETPSQVYDWSCRYRVYYNI